MNFLSNPNVRRFAIIIITAIATALIEEIQNIEYGSPPPSSASTTTPVAKPQDRPRVSYDVTG